MTWQTITWTVTRAGGFTAYILLSLSVILGLALSLRWQSQRWPRLITNELHSFLTLLTLVFVMVHGLAAWLDPFMQFGWSEVLLPFASHYRPLWMALGIVAGYLALAVWFSTRLRPHIAYAWWRRLHTLAFVVYVFATVHGLATGSDTRTPWALGLYAVSAVTVGMLLAYRLLTPLGARRRTYPNLATLVVLLVVGGGLWTVTGPAQSGWNAIANNGNGSGARGAAAASVQPAASTIFKTPLSADFRGTISQSAPDANGFVTLQVNAMLSGGRGSLLLQLQGPQLSDGSVSISSGTITLLGPGNAPQYSGPLQGVQSGADGLQLQAVLQTSNGQMLTTTSTLRVGSNGAVSGALQATT